MRGWITRLTALASGAISSAVLFREAARTSRRWQTYLARTVFSGVLLFALLLGMWGAVRATTTISDASDLGWLGRSLFAGFSATQTLLALVLAPLLTATAVIEETEERTMDMLVLTPLRPGQILTAKIVSRIAILLTIVGGALPVMTLVVNLGGVSAVEVLTATGHALTTVVVMAVLGATFALFTRSPTLAMLASTTYALPFFVILPLGHVMATGDVSDAPQFSPFAAGMAKDLTALVTPLSYLPSVVLALALAVPLFAQRVSYADVKHSFSDDVWRTRQWLIATAIWLGLAVFTFPVALPAAWVLHFSKTPSLLISALGLLVWAYLWVMFAWLTAVGTWAFLRVGTDVVDGLDSLLTGSPNGPMSERASQTVGKNPVMWREARMRAVASSGAPMLITWGLVMLAVFQTGWWLFPGGLLAVGVLNLAAANVFGAWLASRSIAEERRRGTLEVLVVTPMPSWNIVVGKLAAALAPTAPLVLVALPLMVIGVPHARMLSGGGSMVGMSILKGLMTWMWALPLWVGTIVLALVLATRLERAASAFGASLAAVGLFCGLPAMLGRVLPEVWWVAEPARLWAPPLAGNFQIWQVGLSTVALSGAVVVAIGVFSIRLRSWVGVLAALATFGLVVPQVARAQSLDAEAIAKLEQLNRLRVLAVPLAEGLVREDAFTSVWVTIDNAGPATTGTLSLEAPTKDGIGHVTYLREVELPEGTRRSVHVLVRPGAWDPTRVLWLNTRDGRRGMAPIAFQRVEPNDVSIGVVGPGSLGLPLTVADAASGPVPGRRHVDAADRVRAVRTGAISAPSLPGHSEGLVGLDWLIWPAADPSQASAAQQEALLGWVADGGHLLVAVTDTWRQLADAPLGKAYPLTFEGLGERQLTELGTRLGRRSDVGSAPVPLVTVKPGSNAIVRAVSLDGSPLWVSAAYGVGSLHMVMANLEADPLDLRGDERAWRTLLTMPHEREVASDRLLADRGQVDALIQMLGMAKGPDRGAEEWESQVRSRLSDIPGVAPLPVAWLAGFSLLYLLAIGPFDYLVLRGLGRQPMTWFTFPVLIVVFSGVSLAMTRYTKGSQAMVVRVEVVDVFPDAARMRGQTMLGVFSTRKTSLTLTSGFPNAVFQPMIVPGFQNSVRMTAGAGPGKLRYDAETWTLAYARSDWSQPSTGGFLVERTADGIRVTNQLGFPLDDVGLVMPQARGVSAWRAGHALADGAQVEIPLVYSAINDEDPLGWAMTTLLEDAPSRGRFAHHNVPILVGVSARALEPISLEGLSPVELPLLVVRQEVTALRGPPARGDVVVELDRSLKRSLVQVRCEDEPMLSLPDRLRRVFRDVEGVCLLQITPASGDPFERSVQGGDRLACSRDGSTVSCEVVE